MPEPLQRIKDFYQTLRAKGDLVDDEILKRRAACMSECRNGLMLYYRPGIHTYDDQGAEGREDVVHRDVCRKFSGMPARCIM